ncbi:lysophospholipid acyltransferase family protein [Pseudohongiella spirulinae]|uniref:Lipid A biosynthesis acyltransferase n=1 Tax=Pseudohongiella spirulinae TaxID=1249552 RepID=A0A0S2K9H8_9GAMM|nr:lysophospholipid acyltransferase family protein [Pseudohongiella spirulinae]ALO44707.1 Lipid A biosynthesis acyltransferase [Pseudohongiella spirulinae]
MSNIDTLKTTIIKAFLKLLAFLPLRLLHLLGALAGTLIYLLPTETRRVTLINLRRAMPEVSEQERRRLARRSICETIKTGLELGHMWYGKLDRIMALVTKVDGMEHVTQAQQSGKGIIYAAPHLGSWELLGIYVSTLAPLTTLYKPPKIKGLNSLIANSRAKAGAELVATDRHGVVRLNKTLMQGGAAGILPDQQPKSEGGVFAPFFSIPAYTMTLLPKLAAKTGAIVIFAYAERLPAGRGYRIVFEPADPEINSKNVELAAAAMNRSVEKCVRSLPSQYQWEYKRFRKRPEEESERFY